MQGDFIVPYLWSVIHLATHVVFPFNYVVKFSCEEVSRFNLVHTRGKTKVGYDELSFLIDEEVLRLDVAVDDAVAMQVCDTLHELIENIPRHVFIKPLRVLYEAVKFSIFSKFHDIIANIRFSFEHLYFDVMIFQNMSLTKHRILLLFFLMAQGGLHDACFELQKITFFINSGTQALKFVEVLFIFISIRTETRIQFQILFAFSSPRTLVFCDSLILDLSTDQNRLLLDKSSVEASI